MSRRWSCQAWRVLADLERHMTAPKRRHENQRKKTWENMENDGKLWSMNQWHSISSKVIWNVLNYCNLNNLKSYMKWRFRFDRLHCYSFVCWWHSLQAFTTFLQVQSRDSSKVRSEFPSQAFLDLLVEKCRKDMKRPLCKVSCAVSIVSAVQSETAETARSRENWAPSGWQSSLMRRSPATLEPLNPALHKQTAVKFGCFWWRRLLQRCTVAMTSWRALCFKQLLYA